MAALPRQPFAELDTGDGQIVAVTKAQVDRLYARLRTALKEGRVLVRAFARVLRDAGRADWTAYPLEDVDYCLEQLPLHIARYRDFLAACAYLDKRLLFLEGDPNPYLQIMFDIDEIVAALETDRDSFRDLRLQIEDSR